MTFDIIVYTQKELENALENKYTSIALCDNTFIIPPRGGISYISIGNVSVSAGMTKEDYNKLSIHCVGFTPVFRDENTDKACLPIPAASAQVSSYMLSSYFFSSFVTSYMYKYKGSFITSYLYRTSFVTSYLYEYEYANSFSNSYTVSFTSSFAASFVSSFLLSMPDFKETETTQYVPVNGYGINLI
ncbi:MAG: hypothetical protein HFE49_03365 [Clostridia bacterium]|nr:hypothetical protein [Clostridia bacterium]